MEAEHSKIVLSMHTPKGKERPPLTSLISTHDFEVVAHQTFSPKTRALISLAATDLHTKNKNRSAYAQIGLRPRGLGNAFEEDTSCSILGHKLRMPLF